MTWKRIVPATRPILLYAINVPYLYIPDFPPAKYASVGPDHRTVTRSSLVFLRYVACLDRDLRWLVTLILSVIWTNLFLVKISLRKSPENIYQV